MSPLNGESLGEPLTEREAYLAMREFVWQYALRAGDDFVTLLSDIDISTGVQTQDPAAWYDWLAGVERVKSGSPSRAWAESVPSGETRLTAEDAAGASPDLRNGVPVNDRLPIVGVDRPIDDGDASTELLTEHEAFLVMTDFLWQFTRRAGEDLVSLLVCIELDAQGRSADPQAWDDWLDCVKHFSSGLPPRYGWIEWE